MRQQHIDNDTLSLFAQTLKPDHERPGRESTDSSSMNSTIYNEVLDHLALCKECRNQASILTALHDNWTDIDQHSGLSDEQHSLICDHVDGLLSPEKADEVNKLIETNADAMKAALHYQNHSQSMQRELPRDNSYHETNPVRQHASAVSFSGLIDSGAGYFRQLFGLRSPLIFTIVATASLFVTILVLSQHLIMHQDQIMVATYQDNPTIQFTDTNKLPGVGFFSQSGNTSQPFDDISIELISENMIKISWPNVDGATLYKMRIQVFNHGKKTLLKENSTQDNHTTFQLESDDLKKGDTASHNKRYEWVLYGNTDDDRMFYASGGFVISSLDTEDDIW